MGCDDGAKAVSRCNDPGGGKMRNLVLAMMLFVICTSYASECRWAMYFDEDSMINCCETAVDSVCSVHLVAHLDDTLADIGGWQGTLLTSGTVHILNVEYPVDAVNFLGEGDYAVGFVTPLPNTGDVTLATFTVLPMTAGGLFLERLIGQDYPYPLIVAGDGSGLTEIRPKYISPDYLSIVFGDLGCPVLNQGDGSVRSEGITWSTLKGLFSQ